MRPATPLLRVVLLLVVSSGVAARGQHTDDWPQWRGPDRDGNGRSTGLLRSWPAGGPAVKWHVDTVGVGYSSLAISGGRVITQGDLGGVEHITAHSTKDGSLLWSVTPSPVATLLASRIESELKRLDRDGDGEVSEFEALSGLGWDFAKHDAPLDEQGREKRLKGRAARLFEALDADRDGVLTPAELRPALRGARWDELDQETLDVDADTLAETRADALLAAGGPDKDGDKLLSRDESRDTEVGGEFGRIDQRDRALGRGDDKLTRDELVGYFRKLQPGRDGRVTPAELSAFYARRDFAGDGVLSSAELQGVFGGYRNGMGDGPRGTPTFDRDRVYVEGGNGDVSCLDADTGSTMWHVNLQSLGGHVPGWGYSESPLVVGDLVIVTPGDKQGTLVALHKSSGEVVWRTADVVQGAHYSSPVLAEIHGVRQIVQFARENVFGVDAASGKLLWTYSAANNGTANCATPIVWKDHVFVSSAYGTGGGLARIEKTADGFRAVEVYFSKKLANHHGGIVRIGDHMYGFGNGGLICMEFLTGNEAWVDRSVGKGSLLAADGLLFLVGENQQVALADATPEGYREHGRFELPKSGKPSWAHPALADGVLYIRDQSSLTAYVVR